MNDVIDGGIEPGELVVLALGQLRRGVRTRPLATLAAVFGAGYVLGRGLPDMLVRLGSAFAVRALAQQVVMRSLRAGNASFVAESASGTGSSQTAG